MTRTHKIRRGTSAFTLIEVMTAVALMTVSASGILLMQGATTSANQQAQEMSVAADFAQTWMERLKRDSLMWNEMGEAPRLANPAYLSMTVSAVGDDIWNRPVTGTLRDATESEAADAQGFDVDTSNADNFARIRYCMNFRNVVQHLATNPATLLIDTDTVRVDVRVWWVRRGENRTALAPANVNQCATALSSADISAMSARVIYMSNTLRWR